MSSLTSLGRLLAASRAGKLPDPDDIEVVKENAGLYVGIPDDIRRHIIAKYALDSDTPMTAAIRLLAGRAAQAIEVHDEALARVQEATRNHRWASGDDLSILRDGGTEAGANVVTAHLEMRSPATVKEI